MRWWPPTDPRPRGTSPERRKDRSRRRYGRWRKPGAERYVAKSLCGAFEDGFAALGIEESEPRGRAPLHPPSVRDFDRWGQRDLVPFALSDETPCRTERCSIIGLHGLHIRIE